MFRTMLDVNEEPLLRNYRPVQQLHDRPVFHVSPSTFLNTTLLSFPKYVANQSQLPRNKREPVPSGSLHSQQDICFMQQRTQSPFVQKVCYSPNCKCMCNNLY